MSKTARSLHTARSLYECIRSAETVPISFVYEGRRYCGLAGLPVEENETVSTPAGERTTLRVRLEDVAITVESAWCADFGECEYTVWFENVGTEPSGVFSDLTAIEMDFEGEAPLLRGCLGDHENFYAAYEQDLLQAGKAFRSTQGRATHVVFPYFDLCHGDGGTLLALGWAGTWDALFSAHGGVTTLRAHTCLDFHSVLLPGEKVRTGLVVLLPYAGRSPDGATNLWREWFMAYNLPKATATGDPLKPFSTVWFANDTGLPNSDGSISERSFTWKPTLEKLAEEKILPDFRWFDAGWYVDPTGKTVETDWWGTVGSWELDRTKWPGTSFRDSNRACHERGLKVLTWFEPERVTHVEDLARNFGYDPSWAIESHGVWTSNLGHPDCLRWTLQRITSFMEEHDVDLYREDNNSDPAGAWYLWDEASAVRHGLPRRGISENLGIQGHYALWDGILAFCASHGKCTCLDSCASGGGRNDIESLRRSFPLMRSDFDRTTTSMRLSQTASFCKWIPFHGSSTKESVGQLDIAPGVGPDDYISRASLLPIYNYSDAYTHNPELDFDLLRRHLAEWKSIRHLLTRDFYVLTPWHPESDRLGWTVFAYDAPELGESVLLAFRREESPDETFTARFSFAEPTAQYTVFDRDRNTTISVSGETLRSTGLRLTLPAPRSSLLLTLRRNP